MDKIPSLKVREYWASMVKAHEESGLAIGKFCAKHEISTTSFYARRKQLRLMGTGPRRSGFIQVSGGNHTENRINIFPLRERQTESIPVRIQTPNGYGIEALAANIQGFADILGILRSL